MNSFRCPSCGFLNFAAAESCKRCKTKFNQGAPNFEANQADANLPNDQEQPQADGVTGDFSSAATTNQNDGLPPQASGQTPQQFDQNQAARQPRSRNFPPNNSGFDAPPPPRQQQNSAPKLKSGWAITSMVIGCAGFVMCWGLFGLLSLTGLIIGIVALVKASKKPFEYGGKGFAIAGIVINGLLLLILPITLAVVIPNLLAARQAANEASAINSMRTLLSAETVFMSSKTTARCGDLTELLGSKLIDKTLAGGEKNGYKYAIAKSGNGSCELFAAPLTPNGVGKTGTRSFYASTNEGEIRAADKNGGQANKNDPLLKTADNSIQARIK